MDFTAPFGSWLKQRRTALDMTRGNLARRIGYSIETLHKIEGGALHASQSVAERLVEPLEVPDHQREAFIAFATGQSQQHKPHNLPAPVTPLVGRGHEFALVRKWLRHGDARLITIIGPPGVGKTRLALQVAWEMRDHFKDGAWLVALAGVSDPDLVMPMIASAMGVALQDGVPPIIETRRYLQDKHLLLLLDNFDQVLPASASVSEMLAAAPQLRVLATSRMPLNVSGERLFDVSPLGEGPAVELFLQRAIALNSDFKLDQHAGVVTEICNRLDRLPLAIELAASRIKLFDPPQLLARLDSRLKLLSSNARDLPSRHRTLHDAIAVSYSLLVEDERIVFRRLGAFAGGFTLEAAEQVAGEGLLTPMVDVLQSLVEHSLLKVDPDSHEPRFNMLQTILEYSREQLEASGEADTIGHRHAEFLIRLDNREGGRWKYDNAQFIPELFNLSRAFDNARCLGDEALQIRLLAIRPKWCVDAYHSVDTKWLIEWSNRPDPTQRELLSPWGRALLGVSMIMQLRDMDHDLQRHTIERSVGMLTQAGDVEHLVDALAELSQFEWMAGNYAQAASHAERGLGLRCKVGDPQPITNTQAWLAAVWRDTGKYDCAEAMFNQCIALCRETGDANTEALAQNGMGDLEYDRGDLGKSRRHYERALDLWRTGSDWARVLPLRGLGRIACVEGDSTQAEMCLRCVAHVAEQENACERSFCLHYFAWLKHLQGDDADARSWLQRAIESQLMTRSRLNLVESLERVAWIVTDQHKLESAAQLFGTCAAARKKMGTPQPAGDKAFHERALAQAHAELAADAFEATWAKGEAMSMDVAAAFALASLEKSAV